MTASTDGRVARRVSTREAIMDAATELFAARGVTSTSIDEIAEKAGIAKGSIYYNFESKAGLVEAIIAYHSDLLTARLAEVCAGRTGAGRQRVVVRALLQAVAERTAAARMMVSEFFRVERSWAESIQTWRAAVLTPLTEDLVAGGADPAVASLRAAAVIGGALTAGLEWLSFHPERSLDEVAAAVASALGIEAA